jgi:hypothetical protein
VTDIYTNFTDYDLRFQSRVVPNDHSSKFGLIALAGLDGSFRAVVLLAAFFFGFLGDEPGVQPGGLVSVGVALLWFAHCAAFEVDYLSGEAVDDGSEGDLLEGGLSGHFLAVLYFFVSFKHVLEVFGDSLFLVGFGDELGGVEVEGAEVRGVTGFGFVG